MHDVEIHYNIIKYMYTVSFQISLYVFQIIYTNHGCKYNIYL